jgi:hypothetical protein
MRFFIAKRESYLKHPCDMLQHIEDFSLIKGGLGRCAY